MDFLLQISQRMRDLRRMQRDIAVLIGMKPSHLSKILTKKPDVRASTLSALASAVDADWVLVPKHLQPDVQRLLSGKGTGPDQVPTSAERLLGG